MGHSLSACAVKKGPVYKKNGRLYGKTDAVFKSQWDDYYRRGLSYSEGGYWEEAAADFLTAITKRPADQRRARTYGMHLIDYFPNRELGIAYYNLDRFEEAIAALETSLQSVETAKAKYYLNKARKAWLVQTRLDTKPPTIAVVYPPQDYITNDFAVTIKGTARDNYYVSKIIYNGESSSLELSKEQVVFQKEYPLSRGPNTITLQSEDILGKTSAPAALRIRADRTGPLLVLQVTMNTGGEVTVTGTAYDTSGLRVIRLNNKQKAVNKLQRAVFSATCDAAILSGTGIDYEAHDIAGNKTSGRIYMEMLRGETAGPNITLGGLKDGLTTFLDTLTIQGLVSSRDSLSTLVLNRHVLFSRDDAIMRDVFSDSLDSGGHVLLAFSKKILLHHEKNHISVSVADTEGKSAEQSLVLLKKIPFVKDISARLSVAVLPFKEKSSTQNELSAYTQTVLITALQSQKRFNVIEKAAGSRVLQQQKIREPVSDLSTAARLGRLLGTDAVLIGAITTAAHAVGIDARLIDSETAQVLAEKDVYWEEPHITAQRESIDRLAYKFKEHFPLCEGAVLECNSDEAVINIGHRQSIKPGMRFLAFQETEPAKQPGCDIDLGRNTIVQALVYTKIVNPDSSLTAIKKIFSAPGVQPGHKVITK